MSYLLDTNHAYWLMDHATLPRQAKPNARFQLCTPVVGELWFMVCNSDQRDANERLLRALLTRIPLVDFDAGCAEQFGIIRTQLKRLGRPIPPIDVQIAAIGRALGSIV